MTIKHKWSIDRLEQVNDDSGTVANIFFKVYSADGDVNCTSSGMVDLDTDNIKDFINYEDLTEKVLLKWVKKRLGANLGNFEINNASWIDSVINPPKPRVVNTPLPWIKLAGSEEVVTEEAPAEEAPVEEVVTEEAPVEEVVTEEAPAEEVVDEEVVTEEAPAEEVVTEEAPAEEAPVEEVVSEETPTEETPTE